MGFSDVLRLEDFSVPALAAPKPVTLTGFSFEKQLGTDLCWAAAIANMSPHVVGRKVTQCELALALVLGCKWNCQGSAPGICDKPMLFAAVIACVARVFSKPPPQRQMNIKESDFVLAIKVQKTPWAVDILTGQGRHTEVLYGYYPGSDGLLEEALVFDPEDESTVTWTASDLNTRADVYGF